MATVGTSAIMILRKALANDPFLRLRGGGDDRLLIGYYCLLATTHLVW